MDEFLQFVRKDSAFILYFLPSPRKFSHPALLFMDFPKNLLIPNTTASPPPPLHWNLNWTRTPNESISFT